MMGGLLNIFNMIKTCLCVFKYFDDEKHNNDAIMVYHDTC